jgi:hypothetical protein
METIDLYKGSYGNVITSLDGEGIEGIEWGEEYEKIPGKFCKESWISHKKMIKVDND